MNFKIKSSPLGLFLILRSFAKSKLCYSVNGFSCHANTKINTHSRDKLFKLIEYISRGPISNERLKLTKDNKVYVRFKSAWNNGQTFSLHQLGRHDRVNSV